MPRTLKLIENRWWRLSRYEIKDGLIRPARGAELHEYSPWDTYEASGRKQKEKPRPYQSLFALVDKFPELTGRHRPGRAAKEAASKKAVIDWCCRFGLLGVLPQRLRMVSLAPDGSSGPTVYQRSGTGWHHIRHSPGQGRASEGVLIQDQLQSPTLTFRDLDILAGYFPSARRQIPLPLSEHFWRVYAEPLDEFLGAAALLRDAVRFLGGQDVRELLSTEKESRHIAFKRRRFMKGLQILNTLVGPVSPALRLEAEGALRYAWLAPSLLAALAMMALQDLASGGQVGVCQVCNAPFISFKRAQAGPLDIRYCSSTHRRTAQQRAYRQARRAKPPAD